MSAYAQGSWSDDGILKSMTMSNIDTGSPLLWYFVIGAYYVTALLLTLIRQEEQVRAPAGIPLVCKPV